MDEKVPKFGWTKFWNDHGENIKSKLRIGKQGQADRYIKIWRTFDKGILNKMFDGRWHELPSSVHILYSQILAFHRPQEKTQKKLEAEQKVQQQTEQIINDLESISITEIPSSMLKTVKQRQILQALLKKIKIAALIRQRNMDAIDAFKSEKEALKVQVAKQIAQKQQAEKQKESLMQINNDLKKQIEDLEYEARENELPQPPQKRRKTRQSHNTN